MTYSSQLAERVGRIALTQAEVDEWLVQVLISLLQPLPEARVQLLVSSRSLAQKCDLIRQLAEEMGLPLQEQLATGETPDELLRSIKHLNHQRDVALHSYYDHADDNEVRRFRSRGKKPKAEPIGLEDLEILASGLSRCSEGLDALVTELDIMRSEGSRWSETLNSVHEVIVAGHLAERRLAQDIQNAADSNTPIRLGIHGPKRRILEEGEEPGNGEFLAVINPSNWSVHIQSPSGEHTQFGDTGWRDVTQIAQEEDPGVKSAFIRRIGDSVKFSFEGDRLTEYELPEFQDRLAERAFGPDLKISEQIPHWLRSLEGFAPN